MTRIMLRMKGELAWAEEHLTRPEEPAYQFAGDEQVNLPYAEAICYDPKRLKLPYMVTRGVLRVAHNFGATINDKTFEHVKRMAFAPEAADNYLDKPYLNPSQRATRHTLGSAVIQSVFDTTENATESEAIKSLRNDDPQLAGLMEYWGNSVRTMPKHSQDLVRQYALGCLTQSLQKTQATDFSTYVKLIYSEAEQYGLLWAATAWSEQTTEKTEAFKNFSAWMGRFVGKISLFGAAFDLRKDYRQNNISFQPAPIRNGFALIRASGQDAKETYGPIAQWKLQKYSRKTRPLQQADENDV
jgi:hypothetical protein